MKHAVAFKLILSLAVLAWALVGSRLVQNASAQTQPVLPPNTDSTVGSPDNASAAGNLPPDIGPDSPLAQVIRLVQAGVGQSVILTYINDSTNLFNLDADKIIYLNDLGVPTEIINAMMQQDQKLEQMGVTSATESTQSVEATVTETQPAEVTVNYFYNTLAPYGAWLNVAGYGWCWRPTVVIYQTGWQPYCNNGHWVYTDYGWYWLSGYSWGWATFHYGRWFRIPRYGWCWWPDTTWAPSWVCWRYNKDYCGWAPLPPHAVYRSGVGLVYNGRVVGAGYHFGLNVSAFTFVPTRDFHDRQPWHHRLGEKEAAHIYDHTTVIHKMDFNRHDRTVINPGIPPHDITAVTKQPIHPVAIHYERGKIVHGNRHEEFQQGGHTLIVNRPHFVGSPVLSPRHGTAPTTGHRQNEFHPVVPGSKNQVSPRTSNPEPNHSRHQEINQNPRQNFNRGMRRIPQTTPAPSQPNEFHPIIRKNENSASPSPGNLEPNRNSSFNHVTPQTPQARQPGTPYVVPPRSQENRNVNGAPHENNSPLPTRNHAQYYRHYNDNRVLSPRARGFEQQAPRSVVPRPQQGGNTVNERHFSAPPVNHYAPPAGQRQQQYRHSAPQNESRNRVEHFNHSAPRQQAARPHGSYHSSSSPSRQGNGQQQNRNGDQRGH